jgi:asparagine synthase (glutamine-hydrolysing)
MEGICGWIACPFEPAQAQAVAAKMQATDAFDGAGVVAAPSLAAGSAVMGRSGAVPVSVHRAGALLATAEGRIRWGLPGLAELAAREGTAAALAEAYRRDGAECLRQMGGSFAVAVVDTESESGLLAVDRMGIRPLCFAAPSGRLVFGSSAGSVAAHPAVGRELSRQAIFDYLYCHVVPAPGTIYARVSKLRPGECLIFRDGAADERFYWGLPYRDDNSEPFDALASQFRALLRAAAARAIEGERNIGAFLSGGTDSSTVAGLLAELLGEPAKTYSIGFDADGFDEIEYARIAARHFATDAREYYLTPQDVVDAVPLVARAYDEPFGNASAVPTYFCARRAKEDGVRVLLAGDGGDEIFGGNARYAKQKLFEAYHVVPRLLRRGLIEPLALGIPGSARVAPLRKLRSYVSQAKMPLPDRLESYNFVTRTPLQDIFEPGFLAEVNPARPLEWQRDAYLRTASASPVNRMMHLDLEFTLADNDLRKVSRMCEVAGVEARYPLLDDALVAFSGELPPGLKVKGQRLRYFFKQALKDFLPPETLTKTKHGFGMPFGLWMREHKPLGELARESLESFGRRGIVKADYVALLQHEHATGHANYFGVMIWVVMMLERWLASRGF